ncbi:Maf family protein [Variovorax saccharolyticus]|uniref:Maf family protein n=1 Tax=Variovorax saccharolyticus TaxID=3053516 RepID=UPI0025765E0B|nr:Maf family protein [Variovorax sp. J22R187]MDM0016989.1 Maf family protein [Variovorax sp. J22R187]
MSSDSPFIYLASQSPRRAQLLGQLGVRHELLLATADEDAESLEAVRAGESPTAYVQRVTALKLDAAVRRRQARGLPAAPILCADTTVAIGRTILGKPEDAADAARMLASLAGRTHRVMTAIALQHGDRRLATLNVSHVRFAAIGPARIAAYVASGEPLGKAGAYGIQGRAAAFIEHISGSHSGIMGLPMFETAELLRQAGFESY